MMPLRRLGRPGLLGTIARTAVVAGTAQMTSNAINRHAQRRAMEEQAAPPPPAPSGEPADRDIVSRLATLAKLHESGALSDDEFRTAKDQLLRG